MTVIGIVENGKVVLPSGNQLPEGTRVRVETLPAENSPPSFAEEFGSHIGAINDLPSDLARNHDHYIHGAAKK